MLQQHGGWENRWVDAFTNIGRHQSEQRSSFLFAWQSLARRWVTMLSKFVKTETFLYSSGHQHEIWTYNCHEDFHVSPLQQYGGVLVLFSTDVYHHECTTWHGGVYRCSSSWMHTLTQLLLLLGPFLDGVNRSCIIPYTPLSLLTLSLSFNSWWTLSGDSIQELCQIDCMSGRKYNHGWNQEAGAVVLV